MVSGKTLDYLVFEEITTEGFCYGKFVLNFERFWNDLRPRFTNRNEI